MTPSEVLNLLERVRGYTVLFNAVVSKYATSLIADCRTLHNLRAKLQKYATPASSPGVHEFCSQMLKEIDE